MINPWQDLFNTWLDALGTEKNEMKKYVVTLTTTAKASVLVDANNEDEAIDMAYDYLDENDIELGEWETADVSREYD